MSSTKEVKYNRGLTPKVIVLLIILTLSMFWMNFMCWWHFGVTVEPFFGGRIGAAIYLPFGFIWLLAVIGAWLKNRLSPAEIAVLVGSMYLLMDIPFISVFIEPMTLAYQAPKDPNLAKLLKIVPNIWAPKNPNLEAGMFTGGASIPAAMWPSIILADIVFLAFLLVNLFTGLFMKEQFIEVEKLTFPGVIPASEVLKYQEEGSIIGFKLGKQKLFYIGWIIGFIVAIYSTINYITPIFPTFFAWGQIYLTGWQNFLRGINPSIRDWWMFIPADMIMFYLAPVEVSFSASVWTGFLALVWPFIAVGAGMIPPGASPNSAPFHIVHFSLFHVTLALGIWAIIFGYKSWWNGLKELFGKKSTTKPGRLSWKLIWLGFLGSFIFYALIFEGLGGNPGLIITFLILYFFILTGQMRVWGETGQWVGSSPPYLATWMTSSIIPGPVYNTSMWAAKAAMRPSYVIGQGSWEAWGVISTYKLAEDTKTRERDLFIGQIIVILIGAFIAIPMGMAMLYGGGLSSYFRHAWGIIGYRPTRARDMVNVIRPASSFTQWDHLIAAIVIVGILWWLRTKYAWWIFTPVALYFYDGMWFLSSFPAVILKWLTVKFLGTERYEKYAVPFVIGILIGMSFGAFLLMSIVTVMKV